ncbi:MAG TPA: circadian clock protein KaiC [Flavitalea sp.]|nr:circadian clock protein KaiC [Flavitalea sp.]
MTQPKCLTGIPGFDEISFGGLAKGRSTLLSGSAGSGKTIFCSQFLIKGIEIFGEPGVFVSFEENVGDLRKNLQSFNWPVAEYESKNLFVFVDASISSINDTTVIASFDLKGLLVRIDAAINKVQAKRVVLDSIGSLFHHFSDTSIIRKELYIILYQLKERGLAVLLTSERLEEYGTVSRFGVEEYIADNVVIMRNVLENEKRRRTIEILKYRGSAHSSGENSFVISPKNGVHIIPLTRLQLTQKSSDRRVPTGNITLDNLCGGGFFRDSIILVSGATGTGKTLMITEFIKGGFQANEKILFVAYEESREQLIRNAKGWGVDFPQIEKNDHLHIEAIYPENASLEEHLLHIQAMVEKYRPARFAFDSLSAIERGSSKKNFREFLITLTSYLKKKEILSIFTSTSTSIVGGTSVTDNHISTITDTIILLRYAEVFGQIHRVITVLKMRGSLHTKGIHEFDITDKGMNIKPAEFDRMSGILGGLPIVSRDVYKNSSGK